MAYGSDLHNRSVVCCFAPGKYSFGDKDVIGAKSTKIATYSRGYQDCEVRERVVRGHPYTEFWLSCMEHLDVYFEGEFSLVVW